MTFDYLAEEVRLVELTYENFWDYRRLCTLEGDLAVAEPKAMLLRLLSAPARRAAPDLTSLSLTSHPQQTRAVEPAPTRADRTSALPAPVPDAFARSMRRLRTSSRHRESSRYGADSVLQAS